MDTSKHSDRSRKSGSGVPPLFSLNSKRQNAAFSLVEVTIAIGIVAFGFVAIFGLLPTGMTIFRQSINTTVTAQIAQRIINDARQTDFDALITDAGNSTIALSPANMTGRKAVRYFDDQGNEVAKISAIYWVNTRITRATPLPSVGGNSDLEDLAMVTIQVANNPGGQDLEMVSGSASDQNTPLRNLWSGNTTSSVPVQILTYSALVSRNQ